MATAPAPPTGGTRRSICGNEVNVDSLTTGEAILLADPELDTANYSLKVKFPNGTSTNKAGLVFAHDGATSFWAVVLDRNTGLLSIHQVTSGSWSGALASVSALDTAVAARRPDRKAIMRALPAPPRQGSTTTPATRSAYRASRPGCMPTSSGR